MNDSTPGQSPESTAPPRPLAGAAQIMSHVWLPLMMGLVMALAYFGGFHQPKPDDLPVAIIGDTQQVQPIVDALHASLGEGIDVRVVATPDEADSLLRHQEIAGAYEPGSDGATLRTASASSEIAVSAVMKIFGPVAAGQGLVMTTQDVVPLAQDDPLGQNAFFLLVALSVTSYACGIAIGAAGARQRYRVRLLVGAMMAVLVPSVLLLVASWGFGMFDDDAWAIWGLAVLYSAAVLAICIGLHPLVTRYSTLLYATIFVGLNFTSSGGVVPPSLQPTLFGHLHSFWIGSGFTEAARTLQYFPDLDISRQLVILFGWFAVGIVCVGLGALVEGGRARRAAADAAPARALEHGAHAAVFPTAVTGTAATATSALSAASPSDPGRGRHARWHEGSAWSDADLRRELDAAEELELEENVIP